MGAELDLSVLAQRQLRALIYNRNSRGKDGRSTDDTNLENHKLCHDHGWVVAGVYFDRGRSASRHTKKPRPDWEDMIAAARAGQGDVIVYWESSRAYRNTRTYLDLRDLCEKTGILLCYNGRVYDMRNRSDRFMTHFDAMRNEDEVDAIRERNLRTVRMNAERARPHGSIAFGFRREYDQETGKLLRQVPHAEQAAIVLEAAQRVAAGQSLSSICDDFNERGIATPRAAAGGWFPTILRPLLLRPSVAGLRQFQGEVIGKAAWDPIVPPKLYYTVVRMLSDPDRLTHHDNAVKYLMTNIVVCGLCESLMRAAGSRGTYQCFTCGGVTMRRAVVDAAVTRALVEYVARPEFAQSLLADDEEDGVAGALEQVRALEQQLAEARELAGTLKDGRFLLSPKSLAAMEAQLQPQIEAARARAVDKSVPTVVRMLAVPDARRVWDEDLDLIQQRAAVRALVRVTLFPPGRGARSPRPEWFGWDWLR